MVVLLRMPSLDRAGPTHGEPYGVWQFKRTATMYCCMQWVIALSFLGDAAPQFSREIAEPSKNGTNRAPMTKFLDGCGWAEVFCAGTPMRGAPRIAGRAGKVICLARGKAARTAKK